MSFSPLPVEFLKLLEKLQSISNPRILDFGSGSGDFSRLLSGYDLPLWGVDFLPKAAGVDARIRGNAIIPPILVGSLDCILAGNLVRHLLVQDRHGLFLQTWLMLLRPGGSIFLFEDEPGESRCAAGNYNNLQSFLAQLMPSVRGPLFSLSELHQQMPDWTPDQKWTTGLVQNELKPDIKAVCSMLRGDPSEMEPNGLVGKLLSDIDRYGLSYGSYWWAHAQKA